MFPVHRPLIRWNARFDTGHAQIDAQHRELVNLLNRFAADVENTGSDHTRLFTAFRDALARHFKDEEEALRQLGIAPELLEAHAVHHGLSLELLDSLGQQLAKDPKEHSSAVLAEISHCMLVDLLDEDRHCFVVRSTRPGEVASLPVEPVLQVFKRLVDLLNEHHEQIVRARDYYTTLLDDFPAPVCRTDGSGRFDWFNRTWLNLTGMDLPQAESQGWTLALHGEDREPFFSRWRICFDRRAPFVMDYRLLDARGQYRWIHHVGRPFFDEEGAESGGFLGYISVCFDVTERRQAEANLRVSAEVFEHAEEAIMITDGHGWIEAVNPAFVKTTGYGADEVIGQSANLLRSGLHDESFYHGLWQSLMDNGSWQGEVMNRHKSGEIFPYWLSISTIRNTEGEVIRMVGVLTEMSPLRTSHRGLLHLAHHDALTDLPNRLLFDARAQHSLERCSREGSRLAILFLDLDNFKPVNDRLGHHAGDELLRDVAGRLRAALREEDTVARFGGDEFVILVERVGSAEDAGQVASKLLELFPVAMDGNEQRVAVTASIGISLYPDHGQELEALVDAADKAMYRAKEQGRNCFHVYSACL
ncbi:diguanylate cyclase domain-containing protein [Denitratisoma oestradiolicum]|uniref:Diguanylate cyclase n=1 Tax=Denitratisoma oestradiolicum TaxID=311182 RepID=A0A6S6YNF6_9PROT|nr:diguanylate cyclase [Denitratisoma oestradiolicum]TWO80214.1 hypothetical protein CBW56_10375 [Denitratisoma oestradiolicum]CAB1369298.1 conserved protein of unknown function [Denitratisoma oestradiolicum]